MPVATAFAPAAVVGCLVGRLSLSVLLALHPPVLEPDLDLSLRQVEVPRQLPSERRNNQNIDNSPGQARS